MPRSLGEALRAFNDMALGWKIVLATAVLIAFGFTIRDYYELPGKVEAVELRVMNLRTAQDSLSQRLSRIEADGTLVRCIVVAQAQKQNAVRCLTPENQR